MTGTASRGILNPHAGRARFQLERVAPSADLAALVERLWIVRWQLLEPYEQETLPWPCVNLVIGSHRPGVHGVCTSRFVARLEGTGWVVGTKFRPGAFRRLVPFDVAELTDRTVSVGDFFGEAGGELEDAVTRASGDRERVALLEGFLGKRATPADADTLTAARVVDLAERDPTLRRVSDLAARAEVSTRSLQRLFRSHVGVPPKWVIRRFRIHEAAERLAAGGVVDAADLAQECGYFDHAHFIRDFKAQVGRTPGEYAALCARTPT